MKVVFYNKNKVTRVEDESSVLILHANRSNVDANGLIPLSISTEQIIKDDIKVVYDQLHNNGIDCSLLEGLMDIDQGRKSTLHFQKISDLVLVDKTLYRGVSLSVMNINEYKSNIETIWKVKYYADAELINYLGSEYPDKVVTLTANNLVRIPIGGGNTIGEYDLFMLQKSKLDLPALLTQTVTLRAAQGRFD